MVDGNINKENEEEPSFSDPEGYEDSIPDDELVPDVLRQMPSLDQYEECCIIIFGIPIIAADRMQKLESIIARILTGVDNNEEAYKLYFPKTPEGGSKGSIFVEWKSKEKAEYAKSVLDGYQLDKKHVFQVLLFDELRRIDQPKEDWKEPELTPYTDVGDLWWWMQNQRCRDQFCVQYEKNGQPTVGVYTHIKGHEPEIGGDDPKTAERQQWTDTVFKWSPHGTYLLTIHMPGIILWAGPQYKRFQRFAHQNVQYVDFSPRENYIVTFASPSEKWGDDEDCIRIWDVRTGEMKKGFSLYALTNRNELPTWPLFKWSHDEKYFASLKAPEKDKLEKEKKVNGISVYETEKFELVEKKHVIIENINTFDWNPADNIIAYYSECSDTLPAEFGLITIPNQQKLRSGRIYNVAEAQMWWQPGGKRLAVYTKRYSKKQTKADTGEVKYIGGCTYHLEIFEIHKKDVSLMNLPLPEPFINFAWEPNGDKFAVLTGNQNKATPNVYKIDSNSVAPLKLMSKLDAGVQFNEVQWAPSGQWLAVLAKLSAGGNVMFVDTTLPEAKRTNVIEHPGFNKAYWDPTGRYFVTCTTLGGRVGADLGYRIYTFQGRELFRKNLDRLVQFQWRPRPPVKLSEQKLKDIKKNLKKTAVRFEREDNEEKYRASQEVVEKRRKIMSAFNITRERNLKELATRKKEKIELRRGIDTDNKELALSDLVEEQIMIALSTEKTLAPITDEEEWK